MNLNLFFKLNGLVAHPFLHDPVSQWVSGKMEMRLQKVMRSGPIPSVYILTELSVVVMATHYQAAEENGNHNPIRCKASPRILNKDTTAQDITAIFRSAASGLGPPPASRNLHD